MTFDNYADEERAGILEFDANMIRDEAEKAGGGNANGPA